MKMFKRVLTGMMIASMMLVSVLSVSAADSKGNTVYPSNDNVAGYEISTGTEQFAGISNEVKTVINKVNKNDFTSLEKAIQDKIAGRKVIAPMFDLDEVGDHSATCPPHKVKLVVDGLTAKCTEVVVLHYSQVRGIWEVITPLNVDYNTKTITVELLDLSPITVLAKGVEGGAGGTSPSTEGTSYTWMMWTAVAFVAVGAAFVVSQKKSR